MENLRIYPENYAKIPAYSTLPYAALKYAPMKPNLPIFKGNSAAVDALVMYKASHSGGEFGVNPYVTCNSFPSNPAIDENKPVNAPKGFLKTTEGKAMMSVLGVLPPIRRDESAIDKLEQGNHLGAALQVGIGLTNLPSDIREISRASEEFNALRTKGILPSAKNYKGQHAMTMLDGTLLERFKRYKCLKNLDTALYNTKFGIFLQKHAGISFDVNNIKKIKINGFKKWGLNIPERTVDAFNFEGNFLQKLAGKSLLRTSLLGVITTGLLEAPALVNSITEAKGSAFDKTKAFTGQLIKSTAYIGLITAGISIAGAVLGTTAIGSLIGMAIGSAIAIFASKEVNKIIDKLFNIKNKN